MCTTHPDSQRAQHSKDLEEKKDSETIDQDIKSALKDKTGSLRTVHWVQQEGPTRMEGCEESELIRER